MIYTCCVFIKLDVKGLEARAKPLVYKKIERKINEWEIEKKERQKA